MSSNDAHAVVIHHIIVILHVALHLRVATFVVSPQTMVDGPIASTVGDGTESLRFDAFRIDAVLPCNIVGIFDVYVVPRSPRYRTVIHDEILTFVECQRTLAAVHALASSHTDVSYDDILGLRCDDTSAIDGDALAWSRLSSNGDVAADGDTFARDVNHTTHIEHDETIGLTHGIRQRARTSSIQVGHMHHLATTTTRSISSIAFCTRESQLLCIHHMEYSCQSNCYK